MLVIYLFEGNLREMKGLGNLREMKGFEGNLRDFKGRMFYLSKPLDYIKQAKV